MTLTLFSRSQEGSDCWKMACLHAVSRMNGWILTKLVQHYCWDRDKNWLDLGDLDAIFKVTLGLRFWKMAPSDHIVVTWKKNWLDFGDLDPIFKVTQGSDCWKMAFLHPISRMNGWIWTKLVQHYCWDRDKNWFDLGDLDTIFKVTIGLRFWKMAPSDHTHTRKDKL